MAVCVTMTSSAIWIDRCAPRSIWARPSSPRSPVPSGCSQDGAWESAFESGTPYLYFQKRWPSSETTRISTNTMRLPTASLCAKNRRTMSWVWVRALTVNSRSGPVPAATGRSGVTRRVSGVVTMSRPPDPRVEVRVQDVSDQVGQDDGHGRQHQPAEHHVRVPVGGGGEQQLPHAVPVEHRLGDQHPTDDQPHVDRDDGGQRDQRGPQAVPDQHPAPG